MTLRHPVPYALAQSTCQHVWHDTPHWSTFMVWEDILLSESIKSMRATLTSCSHWGERWQWQERVRGERERRQWEETVTGGRQWEETVRGDSERREWEESPCLLNFLCVAVCCSVLQCVAVYTTLLNFLFCVLSPVAGNPRQIWVLMGGSDRNMFCNMTSRHNFDTINLKVCCSVLQCVAVCCSLHEHIWLLPYIIPHW